MLSQNFSEDVASPERSCHIPETTKGLLRIVLNELSLPDQRVHKDDALFVNLSEAAYVKFHDIFIAGISWIPSGYCVDAKDYDHDGGF